MGKSFKFDSIQNINVKSVTEKSLWYNTAKSNMQGKILCVKKEKNLMKTVSE